MKQNTPFWMTFTAALLLLGGCATTDEKPVLHKPENVAPEVQSADQLFKKERYTEAISACILIARKDPFTPGLSDLQTRIMTKVAELRRKSIENQQAASASAAAADAMRHGILPDTYRLNRHVLGATSPQRTPDNKMQAMLRRPVSVHLDNASLTDIVTQIGASQNINFIADSGIGSGKTVTIHAETTPLVEILEYVGRNMGVNFAVGQSIIWATAGNDQQNTVPMETRVYRLRKGLPGNEVPGGAALGEKAQAGTGEIAIVNAIKRFVAQPKGSDISFDTRAHALLIKNTRENLSAIEDIIAALDVRPQQVLIEARYIDTTANDTRELGIDWLLGAPVNMKSSQNKLTLPNSLNLVGVATNLLSGEHIGFGQLLNGAGLFQYSGVLDNLQMQAIVNAMQNSDQTRTLTVPRVTTVNNRTATIHIGEEFQYYDNISTTQNGQQQYDQNGNLLVVNNNTPVFNGTPKTISLGSKLSVTPSIGADLATINLTLVSDISELQNKSEWETANTPGAQDPNGNPIVQTVGKLPIVKQKKIETEMVVRSGETVVMGGLATPSGGKGSKGLPWLADLPWIGLLFRKDHVNEDPANLLIFVTATIIADTGEELIPLNPPDLPGQPVAAGLR